MTHAAPTGIEAALRLVPPLWGVHGWSLARSEQNGDVTWALAVIAQGTVSSPEHLLLFYRGAYIGTATADPRPYTRVLDVTGDVVTVEYRWPLGEEPLAAPAGVGTVRYEVSAQGVRPLDAPPWPQP
ncbi:LppP/LprE family lipoprotein [Mycolicibacterium farcinogenes]|uniref:LppP/LprE family lipoprotein n=1 Tax=Mycolicibacterium farcinogenes TaxID=1802 RepID=A0ACD1FRE0_MYCFR|nr:LppP/LprE family lipoprotein [Mycolicibacterium farcinogenes]QZH69520.1 LppP/LprE family lipoprotein [Mycolicibacterium farcinogenes]